MLYCYIGRFAQFEKDTICHDIVRCSASQKPMSNKNIKTTFYTIIILIFLPDYGVLNDGFVIANSVGIFFLFNLSFIFLSVRLRFITLYRVINQK